jgi:fucose 4-O-acetylase-like acetyltransferase
VARGIGIILVVLGHSEFPRYAARFDSFFHVPIFFFISGYFYKEAYSLQPSTLVKRRLRSLYLPFIGYELFFLVFHNVFFTLHIYSPNLPIAGSIVNYYSLRDFCFALFNILTFGCTQPVMWGFWFIQSLFTVTIIFLAISWITINKLSSCNGARLLMIVITFIIGIGFANYGIRLPRSLVPSLVCTIFFYFGFLYNRYENLIPINKSGFAVTILILVCSVILYDEQISVASHNYIRFTYFLINALMGIYAMLYLSTYLVARMDCTTLRFIGHNSLHILALHMISFRLIAYFQVRLLNYPLEWIGKYPVINSSNGWWIAYATVGVGLPCFLCYCAHKTKRLVFKTPL